MTMPKLSKLHLYFLHDVGDIKTGTVMQLSEYGGLFGFFTKRKETAGDDFFLTVCDDSRVMAPPYADHCALLEEIESSDERIPPFQVGDVVHAYIDLGLPTMWRIANALRDGFVTEYYLLNNQTNKLVVKPHPFMKESATLMKVVHHPKDRVKPSELLHDVESLANHLRQYLKRWGKNDDHLI